MPMDIGSMLKDGSNEASKLAQETDKPADKPKEDPATQEEAKKQIE
jgi:hypothetical protein